MTATSQRRAGAVRGPRGSRLFGLTLELRKDQLGTFERTMLAHPYIGRMVTGVPGRRVSLYLVSHSDGVQQVLASGAQGYPKNTPFYEEISAYLGDGLLRTPATPVPLSTGITLRPTGAVPCRFDPRLR